MLGRDALITETQAMNTRTSYLFPVGLDKKPLVQGWPNIATDNPRRLAAWARQYGIAFGHAHWALPCGQNGLAVIDLDRHESDGFQSLAQAKMALPPTLVQHTPNAGEHWLYHGVAKTRAGLLLGIDVRGLGGYIVVWDPSILHRLHEASPLPPDLIPSLERAAPSLTRSKPRRATQSPSLGNQG